MSETQAIDWEEPLSGRRHRLGTPWPESRLPRLARVGRAGAVPHPGPWRRPQPGASGAGRGRVRSSRWWTRRQRAVATQRARLDRIKVSARVEQADLFAWDPDRPFDAIYDQTCLCALPPALWPNYARRLHRWLRPGGSLFVLFMQMDGSGGPPFHCDLDAMRRLFATPIWVWPDVLPGRVDHPPFRSEQPAILRRI